MLTFCASPHKSEWITSREFQLQLHSLGNGNPCCFPSWQTSQTWPFRPLNFGKPKAMFFICVSRSRGKLTWTNHLCHRLMSYSTFCPSRCPCTITFPSSSMKQPRCVSRTCIPWSTICPTDTRFFVTCSKLMSFPFCPTWLRGTSPTCSMVCGVSSPI